MRQGIDRTTEFRGASTKVGPRKRQWLAMKKPTAYLDTTIISAYWHEGADVFSFARRVKTRTWWDEEASQFAIWISAVTEDELRAGKFRQQAHCLKFLSRLRYLPLTGSARKLADELVATGVVPRNKPRDALQIAIATAHEIDYLLSWNYAHLANPVVQQRVEAICRKHKLRSPVLVSPETIPRSSLGQIIRRREL